MAARQESLLQRLVQLMMSEKLMEKMIMEDQRIGSEEFQRGEMTDEVQEREIAVMKVQLQVLEEWLQEQEK